jgi:hypothetical protein
MSEVQGRRSAVVVAALVALVALSLLFVGRDAGPRTVVVDDFESGAITGWQAVGNGSGGWFVYADGHKAPDPAQSDPNAPFDVPDPPQGKFAAVTDMNGPGTRILYRDLRLEGRFTLQLSVFYTGAGPSAAPRPWPTTRPRPTSSSGSTCSGARHPSTRWPRATCWSTSFAPRQATRPAASQPRCAWDVSAWAGQTRLRLASIDNQGPLRAGVDNIRFQRTATNADGRVQLLATPRPSSPSTWP